MSSISNKFQEVMYLGFPDMNISQNPDCVQVDKSDL